MAILAIASTDEKKGKGQLGAIKNLNTGWNDRRPIRQIDITSIKPSASLAAINKIISEKVIYYNVDVARTGSIYLKFDEPKSEKEFEIRMSNHSKIDDLDSDLIEEYGNEIIINIYSKERKEEAIKYLKSIFDELPKLPIDKNVFVNKVEKKVIKSKHDEIVIKLFKKLKIDYTKTDKQIQQQLLDYLVKKGTPATLKKREYSYSGGRWNFKEENEIKGNITSISTTGKQITIKGETGKDFKLDNEKDAVILQMAISGSINWKMHAEKYNLLKK